MEKTKTETETEKEVKKNKGDKEEEGKGKTGVKTRKAVSKKSGRGVDIEEMVQAGVHLGHRISRLHPKMAGNIAGIRNTIYIIDLKKTKAGLEKALDFIEESLKKGENMVFVCTKPPLRKLIEETAKETGLPYITERWLGGTLTNFKVINQRAKYFQELKKDKEEGKFEKYTKKERIKKEKELQKMGKKFEGIVALEKIPEVIFICDIYKDKLALKEANMRGVKTVAICDTNVDPTFVDYPIPANDDAISSVKYILDKVKESIKKSKLKSQNSKCKTTSQNSKLSDKNF